MKPYRLALAIACLAAAPHTSAQGDWPSRPVRIVVAFPAGSPGDTASRLVADKLGRALRQPVVVENRPGAGGNIGADVVAKAPADGYTFLQGPDTIVTVNPAVYRKLNFKPTDLTPVITLARFNQMLVCAPSSGIRSLADLSGKAKAGQPGVNYASGGPGTPGHLAMELYLAQASLKMTHVPYKGPSRAMQDVLAGQVPCGFLASPVVAPHVKAGKLVGLAVSGSTRSAMAPQVPTMEEAGMPGYDASFREVLFAPKGTPDAIVRRMNEEIGRILKLPEVREKLQANDLDPAPDVPAAMARQMESDATKWGAVVHRIGLHLD
ncbi:tripartite tricarboxylate transporter substrate binding protein [Cupriavidus sp. amp6]|uniref:Bug family tripartite tricarboxylate transporter substrate binding protein n=1 Tax=Cupriavidus sp. amp6 TaxID=388051 RepID=UPI00040135F2|nr:tripartite tricarboxylate transporter substrate binding protein [Cupriavidus sp. amp6]